MNEKNEVENIPNLDIALTTKKIIYINNIIHARERNIKEKKSSNSVLVRIEEKNTYMSDRKKEVHIFKHMEYISPLRILLSTKGKNN